MENQKHWKVVGLLSFPLYTIEGSKWLIKQSGKALAPSTEGQNFNTLSAVGKHPTQTRTFTTYYIGLSQTIFIFIEDYKEKPESSKSTRCSSKETWNQMNIFRDKLNNLPSFPKVIFVLLGGNNTFLTPEYTTYIASVLVMVLFSYQVRCRCLSEWQSSGDDKDVVLLFTDSALRKEKRQITLLVVEWNRFKNNVVNYLSEE